MRLRGLLPVCLATAVAGLCACSTPAPSCTSTNLDWLEQRSTLVDGDPASAIEKYQCPGQTFYLAVADCCDQFNVYYDACGNVLCRTGGLAGEARGNCPDLTGCPSEVIWTASAKDGGRD